MDLDIFDMMIMDEIEEEENKKKANQHAAATPQLPKLKPKEKKSVHFTKRTEVSKPNKVAYYDVLTKGE